MDKGEATDRAMLQPGDRIGRYTIESELGRGLLGISYRARGADGEVIALKVLAAEAPLTDSEKAGIARDFHALEDLQSPQVPVLLEFVRFDDYYVIATDYLPLGDFSRRLAQGPLPLPAALTLIRHLAYAVGRAHEVGVVHGGIKPTNVLRGETNGRQIPVLSDFGGALRDHPWVRPEGVFEGDAYRAPELSDHSSPTPRSDVFSLGTLLAVMTGGLANAGVASVIARATDGVPSQRYANASDMYEALSTVGSTPDALPQVAPVSEEPPALDPLVETGTVVPELAPVALPVPIVENAQPPSTTSMEERTVEPAPILEPSEVAASGGGYRSKGRLIGLVVSAAVAVLIISLLVSKYNVFNRPIDVPAPQVVQTTPVYNGVRFDLAQLTQPTTDTHVRSIQVVSGSSAKAVTGTSYTAPTTLGGQKVCVNFRIVDQNTTDSSSVYGPQVAACGTSLPPSLKVMVTPGNCSIGGFTQVCYDFLAGGLQPGTKHVLTLRLQGKVIGTTTLTVDKHGHASLPAGQHFHFESTVGGQRASVSFAGLTTSWFVANT